jgi:hypothetical protein
MCSATAPRHSRTWPNAQVSSMPSLARQVRGTGLEGSSPSADRACTLRVLQRATGCILPWPTGCKSSSLACGPTPTRQLCSPTPFTPWRSSPLTVRNHCRTPAASATRARPPVRLQTATCTYTLPKCRPWSWWHRPWRDTRRYQKRLAAPLPLAHDLTSPFPPNPTACAVELQRGAPLGQFGHERDRPRAPPPLLLAHTSQGVNVPRWHCQVWSARRLPSKAASRASWKPFTASPQTTTCCTMDFGSWTIWRSKARACAIADRMSRAWGCYTPCEAEHANRFGPPMG